jgi:hypothetical protein
MLLMLRHHEHDMIVDQTHERALIHGLLRIEPRRTP